MFVHDKFSGWKNYDSGWFGGTDKVSATMDKQVIDAAANRDSAIDTDGAVVCMSWKVFTAPLLAILQRPCQHFDRNLISTLKGRNHSGFIMFLAGQMLIKQKAGAETNPKPLLHPKLSSTDFCRRLDCLLTFVEYTVR